MNSYLVNFGLSGLRSFFFNLNDFIILVGKRTFCFLLKGVTVTKAMTVAHGCKTDTVFSKFEFFRFSD